MVDSIISRDIKSADDLLPHAHEIVEWLKDSLPLAHEDKELKSRIKLLLGAPLFTPNLAHFGLWDDLIEDCKSKALTLGLDMRRHFYDNRLGEVLGPEMLPNMYGTVQRDHRSAAFLVVGSLTKRCTVRQDCTLPEFTQNPQYSQLWNEQCFIHCLRMISMGIDVSFQKAVEKVCLQSNGMFKGAPIKGYVRMKNKCVSKDDHYSEKYPR